MLTQLSKWMLVVTALALVGLLTVAAVVAIDTPVALAQDESGPDFAMAPTGQWTLLRAGEEHWYAFKYDFDEDVTEPVEVQLFALPKEGVVLTLRNAEQAELWRQEGADEHFGCCTVQELNDDEDTEYAVWSGKLDSSGIYYIVAESAENLQGMAFYRFTIAGPNISFPSTETPTATQAPATEAAEEAVTAAEPSELTGTGPDFAMTPTDAWVNLDEGQTHWYAFKYDFDEDVTEPVEVKLYAEPADSAVLTIRNAEQAELWRQEGEEEHVGCCTVQELNDDEDTKYAVWAGKLDSSGTYYIVVDEAENVTGPIRYRFTIEGPNVSFPSAPMTPATEAALPAEEPVTEAAAIEVADSGPDFAMAPTGEWTPIKDGEYHWYAFTYDFDEDRTQPVEIKLYAEPEQSAVLTIRNAEQAELWRQEGEHEHMGCCTTQELRDDEDTKYMVWAGKPDSSGTYYIVVELAENAMGPANYQFTIEGEGVSF